MELNSLIDFNLPAPAIYITMPNGSRMYLNKSNDADPKDHLLENL